MPTRSLNEGNQTPNRPVRFSASFVSEIICFISIKFTMIAYNKMYQVNVNLICIVQYNIFPNQILVAFFKKHLLKRQLVYGINIGL